MGRLAVALAAAVAASAIPAQAGTIPTRWQERLWIDGKVAMTFNTRAITINGQTWSVSASVKNNMTRPLKIVAAAPGIAAATTRPRRGQKYQLIRATSISPAFPKTLRPGHVWRGTFRGRGIPTWATYLMAAYGDFEPIPGTTTKRWRWITDHALRR